jgi:hypothetical protein
MEKETWRRIDDCLADALERPAGDRVWFLRSVLGDDPTALEEALKLVGRAENAEKLFAKGPVAGLGGLVAGSRLGPWELLRPLGSGGMGVVWLAQRIDGQATMHAAIKLLPPALSGPLHGDRDLLQRFLLEKQILARLQHPNIARLLDASAGAGDTPNFVMEYVEGVPLMDYVKGAGVDPLRIFLKICDAVSYAHANLVVHRDLKPQNVLVTSDGEPKLLDFGIGKILNDPAGDASLTLRRAFSLDYASPEQIRGGMISTATDIYSLGLLLFEMLTGERARRWNDKALGEVLGEAERFVLPARPGLSQDPMAVLRKASDAEPARRYPTVGDFAADVERLREGRPVVARPAGWGYQAACFVRRNWLSVGAGAAALLIIILLGVYGWIAARQAQVKSRELTVSLSAEQQARRQGETERQRAEEERQRAEEERQRAEKQSELAQRMGNLAAQREQQAEARLKDLLRVFDSVVSAARWDVSKLPGGSAASIKLLDKALAQIEAMEPTAATRTNYLLLRAEAHGQLAELYGGANSNVGDKAKGRLEREKAVVLWQQLHAIAPEKVEWERGWEEARFRLLEPDLPRDFSGPSPQWDAIEQRFLRLWKRAPSDALLARSIATFYFYRSFRSTPANPAKAADMKEALRYFQTVLNNASLPASAQEQSMRDLALANKYLVGLVQPEERLNYAREAVRLDRLRVERAPTDASAKLDLGFSIVSVADANALLRRYAEANLGYREGYDLRKALAQMDNNNAFAWRSLVYPLRTLGGYAVYLQDWKSLDFVLKEIQWIAAMAKPGSETIDLATMHYWKGSLPGAEAQGCPDFREAARLLEGGKHGAWLTEKEDLAQRVQGCGGK